MLKPTVGPIIGYTTTNQVRIFIRGGLQHNAAVFAGIRYRILDSKQWQTGQFVKLDSTRDMTEVLVLDHLQDDTDYEYQTGWFSPMSPVHSVDSVAELPLQWPRETYRLRTRSHQPLQPRCLYPRFLPLLAHDRRHPGSSASGRPDFRVDQSIDRRRTTGDQRHHDVWRSNLR